MNRSQVVLAGLVAAAVLVGIAGWFLTEDMAMLPSPPPMGTDEPRLPPAADPPASQHPSVSTSEATVKSAGAVGGASADKRDAERESARIQGLEVSLRSIRGGGHANDLFWEIRDGWPGTRTGLERVHEALELWWPMLEEGSHPWKGPVLLARANAKQALGDETAAADLFLDALLAMDRDGPTPAWGIPRLYFFAQGPNLAPYSEEERKNRKGNATHDETRSGGWSFYGGSPLLGAGTEGRDFSRWLVGVAKDEEKPDQALGATIWLHAVSTLPWHVEGYETPPAAVRLMLKWRAAGDSSERGSTIWWQGFELALQEATGREDSAALDLQEDRRRMVEWRKTPDSKSKQVFSGSEWTWSLRQEVAVRFAAPATERGKALKALAERLMKWD